MSRRKQKSNIMPRDFKYEDYESHEEEDDDVYEPEKETKKPRRSSEKKVTSKAKKTKKETKKTAKTTTRKSSKVQRVTRKVVNHLQEDIEDESGDENPRRRRKAKVHESMKDFVNDKDEETMETEDDEDFDESSENFNLHTFVDEEDDEMNEEDIEELNQNGMEEENMDDSSEFEFYGVLEYNGSKNVEDEMIEEEEEKENNGENNENEETKRGKPKRTKEQRQRINQHRETFIYLNGFSQEEKADYIEKLHKLKIITTDKIEKATHLVEKANEKNLKTIFGLCKGIWILTEDYLKEVIQNKNFVDEEPYENTQLQSCKEQRENHANIFDGIKIYMTRFTPKEMTRTELNQLMNLTGYVPERNPKNTKIHLGCLEGEVSLQWVFDSILQNVILPYENYIN